MNAFGSFVFLSTLLAFSEQTSFSVSNVAEETAGKENHSVPRTPPVGYKYFAGVGSYKFVDQWVTFEEAELFCEKDGAHLAIVNSLEEAYTLANVFLPYFKPGLGWPRLGFGDFLKKGDFRTIFGVPMNSTGYSRWYPGEPSTPFERNCGCMNIEGEMGAQCCDCNRWFFCEFEG